MITQAEIVSTLAPLNGIHFSIPDLDEYARKVSAHGQCVEIRDEQSGELLSYVLYYDNQPSMFVSMVWTHPDHRDRGLAAGLLTRLIAKSTKDVILEVNRDNPAARLYESLGFVITGEQENTLGMCLRKRIAIMQPYVFPYLGYFHLVDASHLFVFLDDAQFIKRGWIKRNRLLLDGREHRFTVPVKNASQSVTINQTLLGADEKWKARLTKTMFHAYRKAPFFTPVMELVNSVLSGRHGSIADLAIGSIAGVYDYLGLELNFARSSICSPHTGSLDKADRLIEICTAHGYRRYVNAPGGKALYDKDYFAEKGLELGFVDSKRVEYKQFDNDFVPWLSIIDVMMFNDAAAVRQLFKEYDVV